MKFIAVSAFAIAALSVSSIGIGKGQAITNSFTLPIHVVPASCNALPGPNRSQCLTLLRTDLDNVVAPTPIPRSQLPALPARTLPLGGSSLQTAPPLPAGTPSPQDGTLSPSDLALAYNIVNESAASGNGQTVAIVDAFDDPNAESDLFRYRNYFHLKQCTAQPSACFRKVDQRGQDLTKDGATLPSADPGWSQEISLDLDMVSAICQNCRILLVEADSNANSDLAVAENTAAQLGANVISNSYGSPSDVSHEDPAYNHPGVVIVASAGDSGYGPEVPANYSNVVSVGGTSLIQRGGNFSEAVWPGTGGGCSHIPKPAWQVDSTLPDGSQGCENRSSNDIAAVADPNTPIAVYDTYDTNGISKDGWMGEGGTSAAAPIISAMFALAGQTKFQQGAKGIWQDGGKSTNHIVGGSNGSCPETYLCQGANQANPNKFYYNGPTGWGSPNGIGAFSHHVSS